MSEKPNIPSNLGEARSEVARLTKEKSFLSSKLMQIDRRRSHLHQTQEWYQGVLDTLSHESQRSEMTWREVVPAQHQVSAFAKNIERSQMIVDYYWSKYGESFWSDSRTLHKSFVSALEESSAVWVHADIMSTIFAAADTLPETLFIQPTDLVFERGFAVLQSEFSTPNYHGENLALSALSWYPLVRLDGTSGVVIWLYAYSDTARSPYPKLCFGWPHFIPLGVGTNLDGNAITRLCASFLLMIGQPIIESQTETIITTKRQGKRRWERDDTVTALTLRRVHRTSTTSSDPTGREYRHRWVVSAHWRNQWYPSQQCHKTILVGPYMKGPDDKPLLTSDRVYRWVR